MARRKRPMVVCVVQTLRGGGKGQTQLWRWESYFNQGIKGDRLACANNNRHPPSSLSNIGSSLGRRVHPLIGQATEVVWHHSSSHRSLHVNWTFCVGLDFGPWHPKGNCHYNGTTARQGQAHMATLSGAITPPAPLDGFIFSPSSFKVEVKERPCFKLFWRKVHSWVIIN